MNYSAINIQGNIISSEVLEKIRTEDIRFQQAKDFNLSPNSSLRDEISLAWSLAQSHWKAFSQKRDGLSPTDTGTSETRQYWMKPLLNLLGYDISTANAEIINGKSYAISHRATNLDEFPIHLVGVNLSLDKRAETGGPRLSPHALVQEYLNHQEHMYALVSNGVFLRVIRDATKLSRLSYLEFNLQQMMDEGLYAEFAILYRLLHASRMPEKKDAGPDSKIEFYHQEALASGSRIRERLSLAVETSIKELANGFLKHPANEPLRQAIVANQLTAADYYLYNLRIIYRLLFLMVIEERNLIFAPSRNEEQDRKRRIYYDYYSVQRLCRLVEKMVYVDPRKTDLWQSVVTGFTLFEQGRYASQLGIAPLGSGLFSPEALGMLGSQTLDNETVLKVLRYLVTFENENGQRVRVNYADLDVEEFGSVYEGLLEYEPQIQNPDSHPLFLFKEGKERSKSGSHYTPEELVKPLIQHSLEYLIQDRLKEPERFVTLSPSKGESGDRLRQAQPDSSLAEAALLSLKVCDVACGSGHILLSAARRIGFEVAKLRSKEDQPAPPVLRQAIRDVIKHCIYGVDKNPLAVELCKVAMWLEAHNPGEPLNFLDHHIKCGDAIVGLAHKEELEKGIADEAFKTLPGDDKAIASSFLKRNKQERKQQAQGTLDFDAAAKAELEAVIAQYNLFKNLPERTPEEVANKEKQYKQYEQDYHRIRMKQLADAQVAQFFIPKTDGNKPYLLTDAEYRSFLRQVKNHFGVLQSNKLAKAETVAKEKRFFHWFLEFPEVFNEGGFDCILGNPPYLGGKKISGYYGDSFLNFLKCNFQPAEGGLDLVTYFFRRIFSVIDESGFQALISTKTIYQGDSRAGGLQNILNSGGRINFAIRLISWPGRAAVEVTLIVLNKGYGLTHAYLDGKKVVEITSRLDSNFESSANPYVLFLNQQKSFIGSVVNGLGFVIDKDEIPHFENEVVYPYLSGDDLNNDCKQEASRFIINFKSLGEIECEKKYPNAFKRVRETVKPHRDKLNRESYRKLWWQYAEKCSELYERIEGIDSVLVVPRVSKFMNVAKVHNRQVFMDKVVVFALEARKFFPLLQNSLFDNWSWKYSSTLGSTTINFRPTEAFQTFPFPLDLSDSRKALLELNGNLYYEHRNKLMCSLQLGLTKTYNAFHASEIQPGITTAALQSLDKKAIEKQYGAAVWNLWSHLQKINDPAKGGTAATATACSIEEAIAGIVQLRALHVQMDNAVLEAYGWSDIQLRHDFYEVDYLPENDRIRYTIHPDARKELLKRLLALNHQIHEEEVKAGLWDKKGGKKKGKNAASDDDTPSTDEDPTDGLWGQV